MLEVENVTKSFEGFQAVAGASLKVEKGQVVAVIGPNGAGKTTLFNLITGHLRPDSGVIRFKGKVITGLAPHRICRRGGGPFVSANQCFWTSDCLRKRPGSRAGPDEENLEHVYTGR
ncbi:MAG: ATP-binding cassette domain-containing protein [Desulfotomaculales bacterium]